MILQPVMRTDDHHNEKHSHILQIIENNRQEFNKTGRHPVETVFLGDSLTRRWEDNPELWKENFSKFKPANFGVGADTLNNILWRVCNGELESIHPKTLVFLGGTNSLHDESVGDCIDTIEEIIHIINRKLPATHVILLALFPRTADADGTDYNVKIHQINAALEAAAKNNLFEHTRFADAAPLLTDNTGNLKKETTEDGLHLNANGYKILGPYLSALINAVIFR